VNETLSLPLPPRRFEVTAAVRGGFGRVEINGPFEGRSFRLEIRLTSPVQLKTRTRCGTEDPDPSDAPETLQWSMVPPTRGDAGGDDVFERLIEHAEHQVRSFFEAFERPWGPGGLALLETRDRVRRAARALLSQCDQRALRLSSRFHRTARWHVYGAIVQDQTGHVARLARSCPGALLLASALIREGAPKAADAILREAARGRPIPDVVSVAVEGWEGVRRQLDETEEWPERSVNERCRDAAAQSLLLQRASSLVDPAHLLACPPPAFEMEDIPARADWNAEWFKVMAGASRALSWAGGAKKPLGAFVASHHRAVRGEARRHPSRPPDDCSPGDEVHQLVLRLVRFGRATGQPPSRDSDPLRALADARRLEDEDSPAAAKLERLLGRLPALDLGPVAAVRALGSPVRWCSMANLQLPAWPHDGVAVSGVRVTHLRTVAELAGELADRQFYLHPPLEEIMEARLYVFLVRAGGSRLTVSLRPQLIDGYEIVEVRRAGDRRPFRAELAAVSRWLDAVNARARGAPDARSS
jgi:hypothetical protein